MLRVLLIAIMAVLISRALLWVADRSWSIVSLPLRLLVGATAAAMAFVSYNLFTYEEDAPVSFIILGTLLFLFATHLLWRLAFRRSVPKLAPALTGRPTTTVPSTLGNGYWGEFQRDLGLIRRHRAVSCRVRIERFLEEAGECDVEFNHRELVIALERRVPELLSEWRRRSAKASLSEKRSYSERALAILESLALEADRARDELRQSGDRKFETLEHYFARFTRRDHH